MITSQKHTLVRYKMNFVQVRNFDKDQLLAMITVTYSFILVCPPSLSPADRCAVDERNLLYVAITRATHYVILSPAAMEVLVLAKEYPVLHCMPSSVAKSSDTVSKP